MRLHTVESMHSLLFDHHRHFIPVLIKVDQGQMISMDWDILSTWVVQCLFHGEHSLVGDNMIQRSLMVNFIY